MVDPPTWAATVTRVNTNEWKASFGNGTYCGTFVSLRDAEAAVERSISPGGAPLPWRQQLDREDLVEVWYVLREASGGFLAARMIEPAARFAPAAPARSAVAASPAARATPEALSQLGSGLGSSWGLRSL